MRKTYPCGGERVGEKLQQNLSWILVFVRSRFGSRENMPKDIHAGLRVEFNAHEGQEQKVVTKNPEFCEQSSRQMIDCLLSRRPLFCSYAGPYFKPSALGL